MRQKVSVCTSNKDLEPGTLVTMSLGQVTRLVRNFMNEAEELICIKNKQLFLNCVPYFYPVLGGSR